MNDRTQSLALMALVIEDYDDAIAFYVGTLGFDLVDDTYQAEQDKRWVVMRPPNGVGASLLLAKASNPQQAAFVGDQAGGRVFLFLQTDNFWRDYVAYQKAGVEFVRDPKTEDYGTVAVFKDLYGTLWDLIEFTK